ncbi:MAG TPA: 3'-5' exonuclease, partial [Myxococcota bacterium]|nr:3'-5' exonuclease [Myxococcota bacterium]
QNPLEIPWYNQAFFALDVETTGLDPASDRVIELALVPFNGASDGFCSLFSIDAPLSREITAITGISDNMLKGQPCFKDKADEICALIERAPFIVAYNVKFDRPFVESEFARINKALPDVPWVDPFIFICELDRYKKGKKLGDAAKRRGIEQNQAHRAFDDALTAGQLMLKLALEIDLKMLDQLLERQKIWFWQNAHNLASYKKSNAWEVNR